MNLPPVTISILNYQRMDTLRKTIQQAMAQDYPDLEVIVVDNASTDGSDRMVRAEFPQVELIRLPENIGCAARNAGIAAAKGEIVVTIDNDVLLTTRDDIRTIVKTFEQYPRALACINFKILDPSGKLSERDWCHPRDWQTFSDREFPTDYVLEGASALRREAFQRVGGYWSPLFLGHEGVDLALRLLEGGYDLIYCPRVQVVHLTSPEARPPSRIYYTFTRNSIWVSLRNHRPLPAARAIIRDLLLMGFTSARAGQLGSYVRGFRDALVGLPGAISTRLPMSRETYRRFAAIRSEAPGVLYKVNRHIRQRLI